MAGPSARRKPATDIRLAAWVALGIGLYSGFSVATFWGALGGLAGAIGAFLGGWVIKQRPGRPTIAVAAIAVVVNALAFGFATILVVAVLLGEV